ncbi:hypothetical protein ACFFQF_19015 [Haladaptatus pallidirubidus]|nr:hypothetical protein [Haladaptatus pallidirubidus]
MAAVETATANRTLNIVKNAKDDAEITVGELVESGKQKILLIS